MSPVTRAGRRVREIVGGGADPDNGKPGTWSPPLVPNPFNADEEVWRSRLVAITLASGKAPAGEPRTLTFRNNPEGKLDLSNQVTFGTHRSGWQFVLEQIKEFHNTEGTQFDGFLDRTFGWHLRRSVERGILPYARPWVGVLHNPPNIPGFWNYASSPAGLLDNAYFRQSLEYCAGIFVLSSYLANWLRDRVQVPVANLKHPTELEVEPFCVDEYLASRARRLVQSGFWLRRFNSLKHLPVEGFDKICIIPHEYADKYRELEERHVGPYDLYGDEVVGDYRLVKWMPPREYDHLLKTSVVFLDLYDASANNAILECIARSTPVLVNPLPAVVEYLGPGYPLYFRSLDEAAEKLRCDDTIVAANRYLENLDKTDISASQFRESLRATTIYDSLPKPRRGTIVAADLRPPIDTLDQLNVVAGTPLSTAFVFVVCFRNAGWKLDRCLRSIIRQDTDYDFGVVLIDDASEDDASAHAMSTLANSGVPHVVVFNTERKYFSRNLYNAVNLLIADPESVVIEVDGDDCLEDTDVLGVLSDAYELGALKTFGSFRCIPPDSTVAESVESSRSLIDLCDMSRPWDLDACVSWMHLKTYKKRLFMKVPLVYFWERAGGRWLRMSEDLVVHPKMVEIARYRTAYIEDVLYLYDISGDDHDMNESGRAEYLLSNLHRLPYGSFIHQCRREVARRRRAEPPLPEAAPTVVSALREH